MKPKTCQRCRAGLGPYEGDLCFADFMVGVSKHFYACAYCAQGLIEFIGLLERLGYDYGSIKCIKPLVPRCEPADV